ncbi:MAG: RteC domain-containing protein [Cytophagales bacterium]|nr:RteC domain-containing protein [Cytophagales bacterium]
MKLRQMAEGLLIELDYIKQSNVPFLEQTRQCIVLCRGLLNKFQKEVHNTGFKSVVEEVEFFKNTKQVPLSNLIYYKEVYQAELYLPKGYKTQKEEFIYQRLEGYNQFFLSNIDFGQYIQTNSTHFDQYYFTRKANEDFPVLLSSHYTEDIEFNTPKDFLLGQFRAYGKVVNYLKKRLKQLSETGEDSLLFKEVKLKWTANKIDLIELIYALQASGAIKEMGIKEIATACEHIFNTDLGNYYRKFLEIRGRKIERTKFIDRLKSKLIQRMEQADD